ncbi:MAG: hypothetical protein KKH44_07730 [Bacteroidetes bacterium]|nr:hypothetical protein [Bacteroidota bacterium]
MYAIKVNENIKDIESIETPFNVDFYGSLMVMVDSIDGKYKIINAMNGYGNNCMNEYSDAEVTIFESIPAERIVMPKIADTLELNKAFQQCKDCYSNWTYRGKQDQGWCYSHKEYQQDCKDYCGART